MAKKTEVFDQWKDKIILKDFGPLTICQSTSTFAILLVLSITKIFPQCPIFTQTLQDGVHKTLKMK